MGDGWHCTVSTWIEATASGRIIEWNGIAPDIVVPWTNQAFAAGIDHFALARADASLRR